jgi:hypothetical protein
MRLMGFVELAAIVIGIAGVVAGQVFALPKAFHLGIFLIGAGIALAGLEAIATRRIPAMIAGLLALAVGAAFVASAYLLAEGQWHATVHRLERYVTYLLRKF